jgi:hypothetical protein
MKERHLIIACIAVMFVMVLTITRLSNRLDYAYDYIHELENDFPEYIDCTSGSDAYNNWYNN